MLGPEEMIWIWVLRVREGVEYDILVEKRDAAASSIERRGRVRDLGGFLECLPNVVIGIHVHVRGGRSTEKDAKVNHRE